MAIVMRPGTYAGEYRMERAASPTESESILDRTSSFIQRIVGVALISITLAAALAGGIATGVVVSMISYHIILPIALPILDIIVMATLVYGVVKSAWTVFLLVIQGGGYLSNRILN